MHAFVWLLLPILVVACRDAEHPEPGRHGLVDTATTAASDDEPLLDPAIERNLEPWWGDLPGMRERHRIRVLVTYDKTNFFLSAGRPRGFEYEMLRGFQQQLNRGLGSGELATQLVYLPVTFEELLPSLVAGRGDIAAAGLTITPEREARVAFTEPYLEGVNEIVVTAKGVDGIRSLEDLAGRPVIVGTGTSYASHLRQLSRALEAEGRAPIRLIEAETGLQSEDLLEMVNAGAAQLTVADHHIAELWSSVLTDMVLRRDVVVHAGSRIAWAVRKESRQLRETLDRYVREHRRGTLIGNVLFHRYHEEDEWIRNPVAPAELERLRELEDVFRRYAARYGFDWLAIAALAYQESGLDPSRRSPRGAVGLMQVLPETAADPNVGIADVSDLESNVHAGVKYLAFLRDRYFSDGDVAPRARLDFALAAYNAGPRQVARFRRRAERMGLRPDRWFRSVELAALELAGRETVRYVARVNKYYVAYRMARETQRLRAAARRR
jgi:membrane-bound lytic murein transglycosylase MltF